MKAAIVKLSDNVNYRIACDYAVGHGFFNTFFYRLNVFLWNCGAFNGVDELEAPTLLVLANAQPDMAILAASTALADKLALSLNTVLADGFTVSNLRLANVSLY